MRVLSEFIVRTANLAEAEGRLARRKILSIIVAALIWWAAATIMLGGCLALTLSAYHYLRLNVPEHWAFFVVALPLLGAGVAGILIGRKVVSER